MSEEVLEQQEVAVGDLLQFVTFMTGDEVFAVYLSPVQEIIRVPEVVRVPLAPSTLEGLANLRGRVLPIFSLRRLFGFADREYDDATRVLVIDVGQPLGFVVDRVSRVVGVEAAQIEPVGTISSTIDTDLLSGLIKNVGGHGLVMVLNFTKLVAREFSHLTVTNAAGFVEASLRLAAVQQEAVNEELPFVSFQVDDQEYAIAIEDVQEIVQVPEAIIHVPHSESHVLGIMTLRNRLLPLVSLRRLFSLTEQTLDEKSRILVLSIEKVSVGLVVDGVSEVLRVSQARIDAMPPLFARQGDLADLSGICRLEGGKRMVSILTARNLLQNGAVQEALGRAKEIEKEAALDASDSEEGAMDDEEQVVVFRLDKEEFGVPITSVQEIVRIPEELIRVPHAPASVEGVINLRGSVLPVVDLRVRLGLARVDRNDRQRIMVFVMEGVRTGFIVDQVAEVLKISAVSIEAAPQLSAEQGRLLSRMANLEKQKRMIQLLDPALLFGKEELLEIVAATHDLPSANLK